MIGDQLITFFRRGNLKKPLLIKMEIAGTWFFEANDILACEPDTKDELFQETIYTMLEDNKIQFLFSYF